MIFNQKLFEFIAGSQGLIFLLAGQIFFFLLLLFSILSIFTEKRVFSICYLVLCYIIFTIFCLVIDADFFGFMLLIIYVGAIAIFFLFVIMVIGDEKKIYKFTGDTIVAILVCSFFFFLLIKALFEFVHIYNYVINSNKIYFNTGGFSLKTAASFIACDFILQTNVVSLGLVIYSFYCFSFIGVGLVLLVSIVGSLGILSVGKGQYRSRENIIDQLLKISLKT
jgi:NADH-quinone oxidoreductase subunit J